MAIMPHTVAAPAPPGAQPGGLSIETDERIFGAAFDGRVVRRFLTFIWPHRRRLAVALCAVVAFTLTQISVPLVIRAAIDRASTGAPLRPPASISSPSLSWA